MGTCHKRGRSSRTRTRGEVGRRFVLLKLGEIEIAIVRGILGLRCISLVRGTAAKGIRGHGRRSRGNWSSRCLDVILRVLVHSRRGWVLTMKTGLSRCWRGCPSTRKQLAWFDIQRTMS